MPFLMPFHQSRFSRQLFIRIVALALVLVLCAGMLAACGKKPVDVDPPEGVARGVYPREYPRPDADHKP